MTTNTTGAYPTLQRHRRRSDQFSPSSPSYPRRLLDRPNRHSGDAFSPASTPATDDSESPSLNLNLTLTTTPLFDPRAPLPSASPFPKSPAAEPKHPQRSSEEDGRPKYRSSDEAYRPATSGLMDQNNALPTSSSRSPLQGADYASRLSPPLTYSGQQQFRERKVLEPPIKFGDNASSPNLRNYSFSTQTSDKSAHEEPLQAKAQAGKKSRLNLLKNPMNLWARRRSSQNAVPEDINTSIKQLSVPALPDNFDPSIRGKVVHDFSAPRNRRLYSHNDIGSVDSPLRSAYGPDVNRSNESPVSSRLPLSATPNMSHSPMFKEHFQDDRPSLQPERTGYLHSIHAYNSAHDQQDAGDVPAFARRLPSAVPQARVDNGPDVSRKDNKPLPPDKENLSLPAIGEPSPPPPTPPPKSTPSPKFDIPLPAVLPKHMTSTSSRFSFQIGGGGSSTQEKLLEERHKEHEATRKTTAQEGGEDEDDFDYDFDADDGLEEHIPGVNADFDEDDGFGNDDIPIGNALSARYGPAEVQETPASVVTTTVLQHQSLQGFHFTPQSLTFSPTSTNNASQPTPRDHEGFAIGIADSRVPAHEEILDLHSQEDVIDVEKVSMLGGLGISTAEIHGRRTQHISRPQGGVFDDDLYFDDGEFGDLNMDPSDATFDERLFDDETGEIRDIPADNARKLEAAKQAAGADGEVKMVNTWDDAVGQLSPNGHAQQEEEGTFDASTNGEHKNHASFAQGGSVAGLTETNLAAYHDALAHAANQAAANGRFDRKVSFSQNSEGTSQSPFETSQPGVISDDSRFSYNYSSAIAEDDGFPFDDDMDDDLMIAEANAEALENDDDGFYGQEFGFYARSRGKENAESVNGGYFAERGSNGVKRSHSGKANFQEPSLTPITERSEFSTRNSVVSLHIPGGVPTSAQSMHSPGIAQLQELDSPAYDEAMNMNALMKLRGRAFGGSSSSLNSSVAGFSSTSPRVYGGNNPFYHPDHGAGRMSASIHGRSSPAGIPESEEEEEEPERPTLTQNTPRKKTTEPVVVTSQEEMPSSPVSAGGDRRKGHHSRTSSGAESVVSYARSEGGWVLERRRTDEGSGTEVIDREFLAGGRI
ncbi:hypothetical protein H2200_010183 [Cladophialophora chaetospira]|uniref:Uncharacterized protein n=1 Tax=Cladophialophora chaetospira TaxID=386627 RepID=A0AA39CEP8_9EURO|nr:hypothetical protein H2200_010183 [Cladophialophora chaetospira]